MSECLPWRKKHHVRWVKERRRWVCVFCGESWAAAADINGNINGDGEWSQSPWKLRTGPESSR